MFTGLVEAIGVIKNLRPRGEGLCLAIDLDRLAEDARHGDSFCVNGACLTLNCRQGATAEFDIMAETLRTTTIGRWRTGQRVNLERALRADSRLGGHLVQGHVDGIGTVRRFESTAQGQVLWVRTTADISKGIIRKGSICINGVSLTVVDLQSGDFSVSLIPTTLKDTTLSDLNTGDEVNLETDLIGKWIYRHLDELLADKSARSSISLDKLQSQGFA